MCGAVEATAFVDFADAFQRDFHRVCLVSSKNKKNADTVKSRGIHRDSAEGGCGHRGDGMGSAGPRLAAPPSPGAPAQSSRRCVTLLKKRTRLASHFALAVGGCTSVVPAPFSHRTFSEEPSRGRGGQTPLSSETCTFASSVFVCLIIKAGGRQAHPMVLKRQQGRNARQSSTSRVFLRRNYFCFGTEVHSLRLTTITGLLKHVINVPGRKTPLCQVPNILRRLWVIIFFPIKTVFFILELSYENLFKKAHPAFGKMINCMTIPKTGSAAISESHVKRITTLALRPKMHCCSKRIVSERLRATAFPRCERRISHMPEARNCGKADVASSQPQQRTTAQIHTHTL